MEIAGNDQVQLALRYSIYHLLLLSPSISPCSSIPARGISGQTYKGAVFWDTEIFMLPFYLNTDIESAKSIIMYRVEALKGALLKAKEYGYRGAFYAWESQEGGYDACSDYNVTDAHTNRPVRTSFKDKQIHISADVVSPSMPTLITIRICRYLKGRLKLFWKSPDSILITGITSLVSPI